MKKDNDNIGPFGKITLISLLAIVVIGSLAVFLALVAFGFIGFFQFFHAEYDSFDKLLLYIIVSFIIGIFVEIFPRAFYNVLALQITGKAKLFITRLVLDVGTTWFTLFIVDEMMTSVHIPPLTELALAILLFFIEYIFEDKKKRGEA